uniref:Uncharacterized protein n=1 Tax=Clytia hemisphaerica TaxID=252671 RepID=A0A7M5WKI9_9CNID
MNLLTFALLCAVACLALADGGGAERKCEAASEKCIQLAKKTNNKTALVKCVDTRNKCVKDSFDKKLSCLGKCKSDLSACVVSVTKQNLDSNVCFGFFKTCISHNCGGV